MPFINIDINRYLEAILNSKTNANEKLIELRDLYTRHKDSFNEPNTALFLRILAMTDEISESTALQKNYQKLAKELIISSLAIPFKGSLRNLTSILKSCAKLDIQHEKLEQLSMTLLQRNLNNISIEECLQISFALIKLNIPTPSIFYSLFIQFKKEFAKSKDIIHLTDMLYILSCLFILNPRQSLELKEEIQILLDENFTSDFTFPSTSSALNNLWIFLTALRFNFFPDISPSPFLDYAISSEEFKTITARTITAQEIMPSSMLETRWRELISLHFPQLNIQTNVFKGAYELDLLINNQFNIEIDGAYHYITKQDDSLQLKTNNIIRDTLLAKMGITVIRLPFFEIQSLHANEVKKYLEEKLKLILLSQLPLAKHLGAAPFYPPSRASSSISTQDASTPFPAAMDTSVSSSSFSSLDSETEENPKLNSILIAPSPTPLIRSRHAPSIFQSPPKKTSSNEFQTIPGRRRATTIAHTPIIFSKNSFDTPSPLRKFSLISSPPVIAVKVIEEKKPKKTKKRNAPQTKAPVIQQQEEFDLDALVEEVKKEKKNKSRSCCGCTIL